MPSDRERRCPCSGVTLDLHANVSNRLLEHADGVAGYRTNPHIDAAERANDISKIIIDMIDKRTRPVLASVKVPAGLSILAHGTAAAPENLDGQMDERYLLLKFIDLVQVEAPTAVPIDLVWHHRGQMITPGVAHLRSTHWDPPNETYAFLRNVHSFPEPVEGPDEGVEGWHDWQATWEVEGAGTKIWAHDPEGAETLFAKSPSNPPAEEQTTTLRRVHGRQAVFASVVEPVRGHPSSAGTISDVHWSGSLDGDGLMVTVRHATGTDTWEVRVSPESPSMIIRQGDRYRCTLSGD